MKRILPFKRSIILLSAISLITISCAKVDKEPTLSVVTLHIFGSHIEGGKQLLKKISGTVTLNETVLSVISDEHGNIDSSFKRPPSDVLKVNVTGMDSLNNPLDTVNIKINVNGNVSTFIGSKGNCTATMSLN